MSPKKRTYPWTELYNLESQLGQRPLPGMRRRGRPSRPFQRSRVQLLMTDEEQRILKHLRNALEERLEPAKISRSQVNGLALRVLEIRLGAAPLPEAVKDWPTLMEYIAGEPQA
jgi:hypothetical protein